MKRHIPTFDQFVNEQTEGYDPAKAKDIDPTMAPIKSVAELKPGKEYVITLGGQKNTDMIYSGVTDGYHIFNEQDHNAEPKTFSTAAITAIISANGISPVAM